MEYFITFLEGILSFISPCILPLIPVYVAYFEGDINKKNNSTLNSIAFVIGFTSIFCLLGIFASSIGVFLNKYKAIVNVICGLIVILFGLEYLKIIKINIFKVQNFNGHKINGFFSAFLFGIVSAINFTPCIGSFLGSALMLASTSDTFFRGMAMLLCYSIGLGLPMIISTKLITKINGIFKFIKKNYNIINTICGIFLVLVGIYMILDSNNKVTINNVVTNEINSSVYGDLENLIFYDKDENEVNLSVYYGKPIVLNIWATWCSPCKKELPYFNEAYKNNKDEVIFLMVNLANGYNENTENVLKFIKENNYEFTTYFDNSQNVSNFFGISSIPQTYFINKDGKIVKNYIGAIDKHTLEKYIELIK